MEQNIEKIDIREKIVSFVQKNKIKLIFLVFILITIFIVLIYFKFSTETKNEIISEKYIQVGLYLSKDKKEESNKIYAEIIESKNEIYSILALNTILEKKLENDKEKIEKYFSMVEKIIKSKDQKDLLIIKKSLFLIKNSNISEGRDLLKKIIDSNSKYSEIAKEIISE